MLLEKREVLAHAPLHMNSKYRKYDIDDSTHAV